MIVRPSALRHGIDATDGIAAASFPVVSGPLDDEMPQRVLRIGFDSRARLLETVVVVWDDGTEELIHAVKRRPQYVRLLD